MDPAQRLGEWIESQRPGATGFKWEYDPRPDIERLLEQLESLAQPMGAWNLAQERAVKVVRLEAQVQKLEEQLQTAQNERLENRKEIIDALAHIDGLKEQFESLLTLAEHLFQMIDPQTWRDTGGDDGQGHYEGDYRAEKIEQELHALRASFPASEPEAAIRNVADVRDKLRGVSNQDRNPASSQEPS